MRYFWLSEQIVSWLSPTRGKPVIFQNPMVGIGIVFSVIIMGFVILKLMSTYSRPKEAKK